MIRIELSDRGGTAYAVRYAAYVRGLRDTENTAVGTSPDSLADALHMAVTSARLFIRACRRSAS